MCINYKYSTCTCKLHLACKSPQITTLLAFGIPHEVPQYFDYIVNHIHIHVQWFKVLSLIVNYFSSLAT